MVLALDVYYYDDCAIAVGIIFSWLDKEPKEILIEKIAGVEPYIPGEFYRRELPCLLKIVEKTNQDHLEAIIIDGYVFIDNDNAYGLGAHLWNALNEKIPIIGVAKTSYFGNHTTTFPLLRGQSKNPLFISSIGMELSRAAELIKSMNGKYRIPTLLKALDRVTKERKQGDF